MLDELRKLPTCLTNFSAEEKRALDEWLIQHFKPLRDHCVEKAKTRAQREGKPLTEEQEADIRKSWDDRIKASPRNHNVVMKAGSSLRTPSREQMHQELLKAGWTFEGPRRVRHTGAISEIAGISHYSEHPFYSSPHKKLGALPLELAYQKMKRWEAGKKFGREQLMEERAEALYRAHAPRPGELKKLPLKFPAKWPITMTCTCGEEITVDRSGVEYAWQIHRICIALEERDAGP